MALVVLTNCLFLVSIFTHLMLKSQLYASHYLTQFQPQDDAVLPIKEVAVLALFLHNPDKFLFITTLQRQKNQEWAPKKAKMVKLTSKVPSHFFRLHVVETN